MRGTVTILKSTEVSAAAAAPVKAAMPIAQESMTALALSKRTSEAASASSESAGALLNLAAVAAPASTTTFLYNMAGTAYSTTVTLASDYLSFAVSTGHPYLVAIDTVASAYLVLHYRMKAVLPVAVFNLAALAAYSLEPAFFSETINAGEALVQDYISWAFSNGMVQGVEVLLGTAIAACIGYYGLAKVYERRQKEKLSDQSGEKKS